MASLVVKPKQLIKVLKKAGFYIHHQSGSHARLLHKTKPKLRVTVPVHSRDIPKGTFLRILKQANLTKEEFEDLWK